MCIYTGLQDNIQQSEDITDMFGVHKYVHNFIKAFVQNLTTWDNFCMAPDKFIHNIFYCPVMTHSVCSQ